MKGLAKSGGEIKKLLEETLKINCRGRRCTGKSVFKELPEPWHILRGQRVRKLVLFLKG